jgi:hypothetical protein
MIISPVGVKVAVTFDSGVSIIGSFASEQDAIAASYALQMGEEPASMSKDGVRRFANFKELVDAAGKMK